jgi:MFS family permease
LRRNYIVNIFDGAFFGFALGFASFVTILPLFVSRFTDSAILIGLVPVLHSAGWQLPQLFIADYVSRQSMYKPLVLRFTIHERLPFLLLALVAWISPKISSSLVLLATFFALAWQGFGGGFTANPWQSMVARIIPANQRGTFLGLQGAAINVLFSVGAVVSGFILVSYDSPLDFTLCFLIASGLLVFSYISLALTVEEPGPEQPGFANQWRLLENLGSVLKKDRNFSWFLTGRLLTQFATMASAFYIIYTVRQFQINESTAGWMTAILSGTQIVANPILGWLGDRWGNRLMLTLGVLSVTLSAILALLAPTIAWFYLVFFLLGISNVAVWTIAMSITMEFGNENQLPTYIGLANTLVAPGAILAPLFGGWLADLAGFKVMFGVSAVFGLITTLIFLVPLKDPRKSAAKKESLIEPEPLL